jgi:hypothetical protein
MCLFNNISLFSITYIISGQFEASAASNSVKGTTGTHRYPSMSSNEHEQNMSKMYTKNHEISHTQNEGEYFRC